MVGGLGARYHQLGDGARRKLSFAGTVAPTRRIDVGAEAINFLRVSSTLKVRLTAAVVVVVFIGVFIVPEIWKDTDTPLRPGARLTFAVSEASARGATAYLLRVRLHKRPAGFLELQVESEHGERLLKVDRKLRPQDMLDTLEFPLSKNRILKPGTLWLPPSERQIGGMSGAGLVRKARRYATFRALEVEGVDGGQWYFDLSSGILVGFQYTERQHEIVGSLRSLQ